mgnify:CR=1 FL=1
MAAPKSKGPRAQAAMRQAVAERQRMGWPQERIAADIGISREGVKYWAAKIRKEVQHSIADRAARIAEQAETLRYIRSEALDAWTRSKVAIETKTTEQTVSDGEPRIGPDGKAKGGGKRMRAQVVTEETAGEAAFLAQARGALADERDLLGLDAPTRIAPVESDIEGETPYVFRVAIGTPRAEPQPEEPAIDVGVKALPDKVDAERE